ncbi:hypothetical protein [Longimicrobium sp.]|uniref:hypothetical protein n=1 Tax=Longimicrobium sp. TaxID=2029185 RepID=UPI002E3590E3|nr:hypothetical protein [Longimicrobium sp.]HEX6041869.1 hypothetical protein [Longimicrobium sp.]
MSNRAGVVPFRWDVRRREQLGRLVDAPPPPPRAGGWTPPRFKHLLPEVRACAVRVLARAGDARLIFVGRSPENMFDYLTGALADTRWADRCDLLSVSIPWGDVHGFLPRPMVEGLRAHVRALGLSPAEIASAPRPIALVDFVSSGTTFGSISATLATWAREEGVDVNAVRRRLRWVGITIQEKNSPKTWRWFQRVDWAKDYSRSALRGVSVPYWFWSYLGNYQDKTMRSNSAEHWGTEALMHAPRDPEAFAALRTAVRLHEHARTREERARFAAGLTERVEMREPWLRSLVLEIRRGGSA